MSWELRSDAYDPFPFLHCAELKSTVSVLHYRPEHLPRYDAAEPLRESSQGAPDGDSEKAPSAPPDGAPAGVAANGAACVVRSAADDDLCFLRHVATHRTLPPDFESTDHHKSHASEIRVHPSGRFVLVANRGHDSIAVYAVATTTETVGTVATLPPTDGSTAVSPGSLLGDLTLVHITPSGGAFPRNFNFDATGRFVVVGNQNSNNLTVFSFAHDGAMAIVDSKPQPSPNFVYPLPTGESFQTN